MRVEERSLESQASPEAVWRVWSNTSGWPSWNPDVQAMSVPGPFVPGATGTMTTKAGTHRIRIAEVEPGRSFRLETSPIPLARFAFHCRVEPVGAGKSRVSQGISMSGPLAPLFFSMMAKRIADGFVPILQGLASAAEKGERPA